MKFLIQVKDDPIKGKTVVRCEVLKRSIGTLPPSFYLFETESSEEINKLLNDPTNVKVTIDDSEIGLDFSDASSEVEARKISASEWKTKCRPALLRAATTTSLFNL